MAKRKPLLDQLAAQRVSWGGHGLRGLRLQHGFCHHVSRSNWWSKRPYKPMWNFVRGLQESFLSSPADRAEHQVWALWDCKWSKQDATGGFPSRAWVLCCPRGAILEPECSCGLRKGRRFYVGGEKERTVPWSRDLFPHQERLGRDRAFQGTCLAASSDGSTTLPRSQIGWPDLVCSDVYGPTSGVRLPESHVQNGRRLAVALLCLKEIQSKNRF